MIRIAVTGGIACGKSTVGRYLADHGVAVCDADRLAHSVMAPGTDVYERIAARWGRGILGADGAIDRARLGEIAFNDAGSRRELESIVHPEVERRWNLWIRERCGEGQAVAAVLIPLLFEGGFEAAWDAVICISATTALQVARLTERGLTAQQARARLRAQMPQGEKERRSDYVIVNVGSRELLEQQNREVLRSILET